MGIEFVILVWEVGILLLNYICDIKIVYVFFIFFLSFFIFYVFDMFCSKIKLIN